MEIAREAIAGRARADACKRRGVLRHGAREWILPGLRAPRRLRRSGRGSACGRRRPARPTGPTLFSAAEVWRVSEMPACVAPDRRGEPGDVSPVAGLKPAVRL